jgi:ubiquinone/menaquinone biosynthesis C-methylase UbiE
MQSSRRQPLEDYLKLTIETYDAIAQRYMKATRNLLPQRDFEAFCHSVIPHGLILDAGCGWGRDCQAFADRGFSVIGVDLSTEMLSIARRFAPNCIFLQADLRKIPLNDSYVDGIWCCAGLLHLERSQIPQVLSEFKRVMKTGATCCIMPKKGIGEGITKGGHSWGKPRFFTYFLEDEISEQCTSQDLIVLEAHTTDKQKSRKQKGSNQEWICLLLRKRA